MNFSPDASTPEKYPHPQRIREVFQRGLLYELPHINEPDYRLTAISDAYMPRNNPSKVPYHFIARGLHGVLTRTHEKNAIFLSGRKTYRPGREDDVLYSFRGLDLRSDFVPHIVPAMRSIFESVRQTDIPVTDKLARIAGAAGIATAEAQAFSDGNTRIARSLHDFIDRGPLGLNIADVYDFKRDFSPPDEVENMVMLQNLRAHLEDDSSAPLEPDRFIPDEVVRLYVEGADFLNDIYALEPLPLATDDPEDQRVLRSERYRQSTGVVSRLGALLDLPADSAEKDFVIATLRQRKYGAVAWAAAFQGNRPVLPLSPKDIERLEEANRQMLIKRVISLASGVGRGGHFSATGTDSRTGDLTFRQIDWLPQAMSA
jgi:hypothetical protein